jgi:peroxiredoxin
MLGNIQDWEKQLTDWLKESTRGISIHGAALLIVLVVAAITVGVAPARAIDARPKVGPSIGTSLGEVISLKDTSGRVRSFASLTAKNGMILVFSRSLSWCPYCKADAREWSDLAGEANALGMGLAVATYDPVDALEAFGRNFHIQIALLSDEGSRVIRALGLLNEEHGPGSFAHGIPHPMVLVLDARGVLLRRFSEKHYSDRANKQAVLDAVATLLEN